MANVPLRGKNFAGVMEPLFGMPTAPKPPMPGASAPTAPSTGALAPAGAPTPSADAGGGSQPSMPMGGGGMSFAFNALQNLPQTGATPQQAAVDPGVSKGINMHDSTMFDFGGPAQANPALGHTNPAMEGLIRFFRRRPAAY